MKKYGNASGKSGVVRYRIEQDRIVVEFVNGNRYSYSVNKAGFTHVTRMKELAEEGKGLATYIARYAHHLND